MLGVCACSGHSALPVDPGATAPAGPWRLVWDDEFNGTALDRDRWNVENLSTFGDGNHELACLMDRPENLLVTHGALVLRARAEDVPVECGTGDYRFPYGRSFTSAMVSTKDLESWTYGRFEVRLKLPTTPGTSQGLWPAVWMRPDDGQLGEIDVVEAVGSGADLTESSQVHQTIHHDTLGSRPKEQSTWTFPTGHASDGFHVYAVEWVKGAITWSVDGQVTFRRTTATTPWLNAVFARPFFLRLNLAVGGDWPGSPNRATRFPGDLVVDYVRVYQQRR